VDASQTTRLTPSLDYRRRTGRTVIGSPASFALSTSVQVSHGQQGLPEHAPGVFFRPGIEGDCGVAHFPTFDFNDDALETGMLVMSMLALH